MAYNPFLSYSYGPAVGGFSRVAGRPAAQSPVRQSAINRYSSPGWGNVFQQNLGGRTANPMDYSLYTNYYSPTPALSLAGAVEAEKNRMLMQQPTGNAALPWLNKNMPQIYTGKTRYFTMG